MSPQSASQCELLDLIDQLEGDPHSVELRLKMRGLLLADAGLRAYFIQQTHLIGGLRWLVQPVSVDTAGNIRPRMEPQLPQKPRALPPRLGSHLLSIRWPVALATLLVAIVSYGTFALIAWNLRPDEPPTLAASVAVVRDTVDVQWSNDAAFQSVHASILPNQPLKIESGRVELELKAGTKLVIEGPADWSVDGDNNVSLRAGKLMASVPKQAVGFSVETPTAKIVDLGTEFSVEADTKGATTVEVRKGKVEIQPDPKSRKSSSHRAITLTAGNARRIESITSSGEVVIREIVPSPNRIAQHVDKSLSQPILVQGAFASSNYAGWSARSLIDGSGLDGERHSAEPTMRALHDTNNMWLSEIRKIKNEFVLFDLSHLHRLESMKIWNFNDGRGKQYTSRGVKEADIYVSISGKGDPLTADKEWKLVVPACKFSMASGTDDYDTPDVISLGNVEAHFVAIVIKDHLGPDPRGVFTDECVGLSEVQFFGERIENASSKKSNPP